ncbi:MAG: ectonucleotide pyrophosphatase/phosphodiesterase [Myxococcota bacterium]|nr:ectonucleotide pyrophosphatase/phosphodiesterase [Myxococcota bacterium]
MSPISFAAMSNGARRDGSENRRVRTFVRARMRKPWRVGGHRFALVVCALGAFILAAAWANAGPPAPPTVILISLDGTRPADVDRETLPTLVDLTADGVRARGLIPATPANTFPSHVTLVTGVPPDRHGLVNNFFIDPDRGPFKKRDIPSWIEVEPLWSWLEARGVATASYHWVGSEGRWPAGHAPSHWRRFSSSTPPLEKVKTMLAWLDLDDPDERPRFITVWFPGADHVAHRDGPGSARARAALAKQDKAFVALRDGLQQRGLVDSTTVIVVSDHGMAAAQRLLDFDDVLDDAGIKARVSGLGGFANVYLRGRGLDAAARMATYEKIEALAAEAGIEAVRVTEDDPEARFSHPRFGDMVLRAPLGTALHRRGLPTGGFHGYASDMPAMHGLFMAFGREVGAGAELDLVRAIDVAPTVLALLGFEAPEWMEGTAIALSSAAPMGSRENTNAAGESNQ